MTTAFHVIVELDLDEQFDSLRKQRVQAASKAKKDVRRPLRGITLKEETFASMSVVSPFDVINIENSSADPQRKFTNYTTNFILQRVSEQRTEKFQPVTTFGSTYGFFFGEQPRITTFHAVLLNTADFQWEIEWWHNYENYLRGTKLTDREARIHLQFDDQIVEGYLINASTGKDTMSPAEVPLAFSMWVTNVEYLSVPGDKRFPQRAQTSWEADGVGTFESTTAPVRARNIAALAGGQPTGLLSKLRNTINDIEGFVNNTLSQVKNFLYGRNIVIPAGFAGSEVLAGHATFASGSGFENLADVVIGRNGQKIVVKLPRAIAPIKNIANLSNPPVYYDNLDEYLERENPPVLETEELLPSLDPSAELVARAEGAFAAEGYDIANETGHKRSDILRAMGRLTFGVLSVTATSLLNTQATAGLGKR